MSPPAGDDAPEAPDRDAGMLTEHALAYGALAVALLQNWQRSLLRRLLGLLLAVTGLLFTTLLLSFGTVAAAWDTAYRWPVLFSVAAFYLLLGAAGVWLVARAGAAVPPGLLGNEIRKDARLVSATLKGWLG